MNTFRASKRSLNHPTSLQVKELAARRKQVQEQNLPCCMEIGDANTTTGWFLSKLLHLQQGSPQKISVQYSVLVGCVSTFCFSTLRQNVILQTCVKFDSCRGCYIYVYVRSLSRKVFSCYFSPDPKRFMSVCWL